MSDPKKHHYIPQFYLSKWISDENEKFQYHYWIENRLISSRISAKNTAFEHYLYSLENVPKEQKQAMEKILVESQEEYESLKGPDDPPTFLDFSNETYPDRIPNFGISTLSDWMCNSKVLNEICNMHW